MDTSPEAAGFAPDRLDRITDHLDRNYVQNGKIAGCQTLVARHGIPAYFSSLGQMDRERKLAVQEDTIFRLFSMTKPVTSVALMTLYEKGYFQLNDHVSRVLPSWKEQRVWVSGEGDAMDTRAPASPMTFRHLLSHTSGLTYGGGLAALVGSKLPLHPVEAAYVAAGVPSAGETLQSFVDKLATVPLRFDPGTQWMYSYATDVCAALVEVISGKPYDEYLHETILDPLGMHDTGFYVPADKVSRFAAGYGRARDKSLRLIEDPATSRYLKQPAFLSGGGGLVGTTADYFRFCEMLRQGGELDGQRVLGPLTIELMTRNHLRGGGDLSTMAIGAFSETAYEGIGFGLGFATTLDEVRAGSMGAGDFYWGGAASTIFWIDPVEDLVVIFMAQIVPSATFNFRGQIKSIVYSSIVD